MKNIALNAPFLLPVFWFGVSFLISRVSGWFRLAQDFPGKSNISGEKFWFASARFGDSFLGPRYGGSLFLNVGNEGIALSVFFPFRFGHAPIFLPWNSISSIHEESFLLTKYYVLSGKDFTIKFNGRAGEFISSKFKNWKDPGANY